jgi:hypothetical protein
MLVMICLFKSVCLAATSVRIENIRKVSVTERVPSAESFLPVKGNVSGLRWHWQFMLTLQTWLTNGSINRAILSGLLPKMLTCWP